MNRNKQVDVISLEVDELILKTFGKKIDGLDERISFFSDEINLSVCDVIYLFGLLSRIYKVEFHYFLPLINKGINVGNIVALLRSVAKQDCNPST